MDCGSAVKMTGAAPAVPQSAAPIKPLRLLTMLQAVLQGEFGPLLQTDRRSRACGCSVWAACVRRKATDGCPRHSNAWHAPSVWKTRG